ncbi:MAG: hypothetical protein LC808_44110, partial [Actinobacteria bacterium]|nr:hypothetical protein [Actinomycetota bacterium]
RHTHANLPRRAVACRSEISVRLLEHLPGLLHGGARLRATWMLMSHEVTQRCSTDTAVKTI